jgi:hypothetical protein
VENISGALKKGGKVIGCVLSSDVIGQHIGDQCTPVQTKRKSREAGGTVEWGNEI